MKEITLRLDVMVTYERILMGFGVSTSGYVCDDVKVGDLSNMAANI